MAIPLACFDETMGTAEVVIRHAHGGWIVQAAILDEDDDQGGENVSPRIFTSAETACAWLQKFLIAAEASYAKGSFDIQDDEDHGGSSVAACTKQRKL